MSFSKIHSPGQTKMISSCICDAAIIINTLLHLKYIFLEVDVLRSKW